MHTSSSSLSRTCCCTARLGGAHREPQARAHRPRGNATPSLFASTCCGTCHIDIDCVRLGRHALRAWAGRDVRLCARNVPADGPQKRGRMYTAAWPVGPTRFVQHSYKYNVVFSVYTRFSDSRGPPFTRTLICPVRPLSQTVSNHIHYSLFSVHGNWNGALHAGGRRLRSIAIGLERRARHPRSVIGHRHRA